MQAQAGDLHSAAGTGDIVRVRQLLDQGADVNVKNTDQRTPLHEAAWNGHTGTAELLLGKGADVNARESNQRTPLHEAAWNGHTGIVELLLGKGADVNARDTGQRTPLYEAAVKGHTGTVELLLGKGADINARASDHSTPLYWAAWNGHTETVELLLGKGAGAIPEEARRHYDRGNAAVEMAKNPADYIKAIAEYEKAKSLAPAWADVYYNLALTQELAKKYGDAATSLKQYLRLAPEADNAEVIKSHINKLEYQAENVLTLDDIAEVLASFVKWEKTGESRREEIIFNIKREGTNHQGYNIVRVFTSYAFAPHVAEFATLKVDGPTIKYTTKFRSWDLHPILVEEYGAEGFPHENQIEVVSREHVIVKQKITDHRGRVEFVSCEYVKKAQEHPERAEELLRQMKELVEKNR